MAAMLRVRLPAGFPMRSVKLVVGDPGAVVAEPGPSGSGAQVPGCGAAGGAGAALGQDHRRCTG